MIFTNVRGLLQFSFHDFYSSLNSFMTLFVLSSFLLPSPFTVFNVAEDEPTLETVALCSPSSVYNAPLTEGRLTRTAWSEMSLQRLGLQIAVIESGWAFIYLFNLVPLFFFLFV